MKKDKPKKESGSTLQETLKEIRSKFGDESIMTLNEKPNVDVDALTTGSIGLNAALGIGGLPRGRIIEVFGPESSGKTTLALTVIAQAQHKGEECAFIDAEHGMDPQYAKKLGVDINKLLISQPDNGEQAMQIVDALVRGGKVGVIVVDSVAALTPRAEIEGEVGEIKVGALARLMSQSMRMLTGSVAKSKTIVIFINQIRMTMMTFGGANPETTSGGKALKFYASVRLDIRKIASIKKGEDQVGSRVRIKVVKNKVAAPFKQTELDVMFNEGFSREGELIALGEKFGIVTKSGLSYEFGDNKIGRGYDATRTFLREHPELAEEITKAVLVEMAKQ
jgi:recombination protein RecA